jgi:hypothetical protein
MTAEEQAAVRAIARQHLVNAEQAADAFIEGRQLPPLVLKVDLLKLDVEGAELEIIEGASQMDWGRVRRIALEFHNFIRSDTGLRVANALRAHGYDQIDFRDDPAIGMIRASRDRRA